MPKIVSGELERYLSLRDGCGYLRGLLGGHLYLGDDLDNPVVAGQLILSEHCFKRTLLQLLNEEKQVLGQRLHIFFFQAASALLEACTPGFLVISVCYHIGCIDSHRPQETRLLLEECHVQQNKVAKHLSNHLLLFVEIGYHYVSLHEAQD